MAAEFSREELQEQLAAERLRNDALSKRLSAIDQTTVLSRSGTVTEAVDGNFKDFEDWKNTGLARGYSHPRRTSPKHWAFMASGGLANSILGEWDGSQEKGYFIQRRSL
jgi:hypothetical protein